METSSPLHTLQDLRSAVDASTGLEGIKAKSKAVRLLIIQLYAKCQLQVRGLLLLGFRALIDGDWLARVFCPPPHSPVLHT